MLGLPNGERVIKKLPTLMRTVIFCTTEGTGAVRRIECHNVHTFCTIMLSDNL